MAFSPDKHTIASASLDRTVRLRDATDPTDLKALGELLTGDAENVYAVAFSPDGNTLASGGDNKIIRLWNLTDPSAPILRGTLTGHAHGLTSVAFSSDGRTLVTGGGDQTVRLLVLDVELAIKRICATTRNTLTEEKWRQHVSDPNRRVVGDMGREMGIGAPVSWDDDVL